VLLLQREIHEITCSSPSVSNLKFIFHDSPGFEAGSETQLEQVKSFIANYRANKLLSTSEANDQLHAIWYV